jgi:hypothetical protein
MDDCYVYGLINMKENIDNLVIDINNYIRQYGDTNNMQLDINYISTFVPIIDRLIKVKNNSKSFNNTLANLDYKNCEYDAFAGYIDTIYSILDVMDRRNNNNECDTLDRLNMILYIHLNNIIASLPSVSNQNNPDYINLIQIFNSLEIFLEKFNIIKYNTYPSLLSKIRLLNNIYSQIEGILNVHNRNVNKYLHTQSIRNTNLKTKISTLLTYINSNFTQTRSQNNSTINNIIQLIDKYIIRLQGELTIIYKSHHEGNIPENITINSDTFNNISNKISNKINTLLNNSPNSHRTIQSSNFNNKNISHMQQLKLSKSFKYPNNPYSSNPNSFTRIQHNINRSELASHVFTQTPSGNPYKNPYKNPVSNNSSSNSNSRPRSGGGKQKLKPGFSRKTKNGTVWYINNKTNKRVLKINAIKN